MSESLIINLAFEDPLHEAVLRKIFSQLCFSVGKCFSHGGYGYLLNLPGLSTIILNAPGSFVQC